MAARLRLVLLVLALAYSAVFGPAGALGAHHRVHRPLRLHLPRLGPEESLGDRAARYARRLLGVPYRYGGDSPQSGFDCSGLVRFVYAHFGVELPHSSYADFDLGTRVSREALRPGDLVFFDGVGHVGMYIGGGRFIHAPHTGTHVQVTSLDDPWYRDRYDGARRLSLPRALVLRQSREQRELRIRAARYRVLHLRLA